MKNYRFPFTSNLNPTFTVIVSRTSESEYDDYEEARADYPDATIYYEDDDGNKRDAETGTMIDDYHSL